MAWRILAAASVVLSAAFAILPGVAARGPADGWDPAAVARYLDGRMDVWWANAKVLRTGDGQTRCISCHTALPYALVRPALRGVLAERTPIAHETRMIEQVRRRIAVTAGDQPYYDHTEAKKSESRGVEAVLNAVVLTQLNQADAPESDAHIRTAMTRLWEAQRGDGAWNWLDFGLEPYETPDAVFYGAALAALAAGSPAGMRASADANGVAGLERLRQYLRSTAGSQRLFNRAWALVAASRLDGVLTPSQRASITEELESRQRSDGGWSLADLGPWRWQRSTEPFAPPGKVDTELLAASDAYATGLVIYAMRQSGFTADRMTVRKGQQWLRAHQSAPRAGEVTWAPWRSHSLNFDREHGGAKGEPWRRMFMSDLATAFAALALM